LFLFAPTATAQEEPSSPDQQTIELSDEARRLNDEAVSAIIKGDYTPAIALLEQLREFGESNVVFLNLGRAYQKLGQCRKARDMLTQVESAPAVGKPSPELVRKKARKYMRELTSDCPEKPDDASAKSTGTEDQAAACADTSDRAQAPTSNPRSTWRKQVGWAGVSTGVAAGVGGLALHFVAKSKRESIGGLDGEPANVRYPEAIRRRDQANKFDTIGVSLGILGVMATGMGAYFLLSESTAESTANQISLSTLAGGIGVVWSGRL
jgi:hypothetical protein